jgi:hypothetical protein
MPSFLFKKIQSNPILIGSILTISAPASSKFHNNVILLTHDPFHGDDARIDCRIRNSDFGFKIRNPQSAFGTSFDNDKRLFLPKLSDFFTPHKGGGEAEKPFRAITFNRLNHQEACSIITCLVNP